MEEYNIDRDSQELSDFERTLKNILEEAIDDGDTHNLKADADMLLRAASKHISRSENTRTTEGTLSDGSLNDAEDKGEISDGYHTFNELYLYRMLYNAAFFNLLPKGTAYKSKRHHDGEECFGGGWFVVTANLPTGQISNHYELKYWDLFDIQVRETADEWDGHTPKEAAERLYRYLAGRHYRQKPAKDEIRIRQNIIDILSDTVNGTKVTLPFTIYEEAVAWLNPNLKEEDISMVDAIIYGIEDECKRFDTPYFRQHCSDKIEWLKKLRRRLTCIAKHADETSVDADSEDVDFENEMHKWIQDNNLPCFGNTLDDIMDTARHFFEMGLNSNK